MNRIELREMMQTLRVWDVPATDTKFTAKMNSVIDLAYMRVADECPEALSPSSEYILLPKAYSTSSTGSKVSTTADPYVLEFTAPPSGFTPKADGTFDGVYWLEVVHPTSGAKLRHQCREFWTTVSNNYVSLVRPWNSGTITNATFNLYAPYVWLESDVMNVLDAYVYASNGTLVQVKNSTSQQRNGRFPQYTTVEYGTPTSIRRGDLYQHPSPNKAPTATTTYEQGTNTWLGPEPVGTFDYCFTYCWGYRTEYRTDNHNLKIPLFESAPSPSSAKVSVNNDDTFVTLTLPEIDWQLNFNVAGSLRATHSGWYKRIYRRRYTTGTVNTHTTIEAPEVFQVMGDVSGEITSYVDNGVVIPDYDRRLPTVHGYYAWELWPVPTGDTELDLRVLRRPKKLANDYDAPAIAHECIDGLVFYALAYLARMDKDEEGAGMYELRAKEVLKSYRGRYAAPASVIEANRWTGSRSIPGRSRFTL